MSKGDDIVPIPGTKHRARLEENIAAAAVVLTPEEIATLDAAIPPGTTAGDRYLDMSTVNR